MPEAAEGGPLAIVQNGDPVVIDMNARRLDLGIRLRGHMVRLCDERPGWLRLYRELVQPLSQRAVPGRR